MAAVSHGFREGGYDIDTIQELLGDQTFGASMNTPRTATTLGRWNLLAAQKRLRVRLQRPAA
jgi:hypothetical protein